MDRTWPDEPRLVTEKPRARSRAVLGRKVSGDQRMTAKAEMLETLRTMLRDVFRLRNDGVTYARLARAHGYVDGYMRALLESNVCEKSELLSLVAEERARVDGPATAEVASDAATVAA